MLISFSRPTEEIALFAMPRTYLNNSEAQAYFVRDQIAALGPASLAMTKKHPQNPTQNTRQDPSISVKKRDNSLQYKDLILQDENLIVRNGLGAYNPSSMEEG